MSSPWDRAAAVIVAGPLGTAAEYQAAGSSSWSSVRVVLAEPDEVVPGIGQGRAIAKRALVNGADLAARPGRGDLIRWGSPAVTYQVQSAAQDTLGLSWSLALSVHP